VGTQHVKPLIDVFQQLRCLISDIAEIFIPISDRPTEAQSDIAHHGYRTHCPPMSMRKAYVEEESRNLNGTKLFEYGYNF
jgi:hypothetical protein